MAPSASTSLPLYDVSVGDSLLIYWNGDRKWYSAEITAVRADHSCKVVYEDGEREWLSLAEVKYMVKKDWKGSIRGMKKARHEEDGDKEEKRVGVIKKLLLDIGNTEVTTLRRSVHIPVKHKPIDTSSFTCNSVITACRRSKRLQHKKLTEDASKNMSSDELDHLPMDIRRRSKRLEHKKLTENISKNLFSDEVDHLSDDICSAHQSLSHSSSSESLGENISKCSSTFSFESFECSSDDSSVQNVPQTRRSMRSFGVTAKKLAQRPKRKKGSESVGNTVAGKKEYSHSRELGYPDANTDIGISADYLDGMCVDDSVENGTCGFTNAPLCSACQTGVASDFLVQCIGADCIHAMHTFCFSPTKEIDANWLCPYCEKDSLCTEGLMKNMTSTPKKIQSIVGYRRIKVQDKENALQDHFLVKWKSLSHYHDSWVPLEWIYMVDRLRLVCYQRKFPLANEEILVDQRKPEWFKVDRVIACRKKSNPDKFIDVLTLTQIDQDRKDLEFLVKWMGLDYDDATWESHCTEELLSAASKLVNRHQRAAEKVDNHPSTSVCKFDKSPDYLSGGDLYDYQVEGLNWMLSNFSVRNNVILADEMGLGKTVQVVSFIKCMKHESLSPDPTLIIAPKSILLHWEKEFCCWAPDLNVIIYHGEKQSRRCIELHELYSPGKTVLFDALVTNYELVLLDNRVLKKFKWSAIIIDEAHKIKSLDCKLASCLNRYISDFRLLLTGTPLQNTLLELFALLHFLDPKKFSEPKSEAQIFSTIGTEFEDGESLNSDVKVSQIHDLLRPRMLRRMKSDALPESIPAKKWVEVPCALTDCQRELYINILEKNYKKLNDSIQSGRKITLNFILMELKKCCNHPYLFPGQEACQSSREAALISLIASSGKLQLLEKLLPKLKERENRVLLFSQMTKMLDILEDFLTFLGLAYFRIDGQTSISVRQQQMKEFNRPGCTVSLFLISTRAGGLGIDLPTADRVIIYDPDFNPFMDLQAQSRAHRIGQKRPVVVYQLITKCTVEEKILQKSRRKLAIENLVMNTSRKPNVKDLHSVLLHGARKILSRKEKLTFSFCYDDNAIETLIRLDPAPDEKYVPDENGYLGSIHSFGAGIGNEEPPPSPKAEDWKKVLGQVADVPVDAELGRGKRQKRAVNYNCEAESDSDEMYSPESSNSDFSSDEDTEPENNCSEI